MSLFGQNCQRDNFRDSHMMTSSNGNIFRVTGPLCGEFTGHRWIPLTKASDAGFDVFFDLRMNKQLSKQSWGWWHETPSRSLWHHCNEWRKFHQKWHSVAVLYYESHYLIDSVAGPFISRKSINYILVVNTFRPRQNYRHFAYHIFKSIFPNENISISISISLNFASKCQIHNILALVQVKAPT